MRELKLREARHPAQGHTVSQWKCQDLGPGLCDPKPIPFVATFHHLPHWIAKKEPWRPWGRGEGLHLLVRRLTLKAASLTALLTKGFKIFIKNYYKNKETEKCLRPMAPQHLLGSCSQKAGGRSLFPEFPVAPPFPPPFIYPLPPPHSLLSQHPS